jgi:FkbM family methyltransferase
MTYSHLGQYEKAIDCAKKALEAAPGGRVENNVRVWEKRLVATVRFGENAYMIRGMSAQDHIFRVMQSSGQFYEIPLLKAIRDLGAEGVYVDVGAHVGNHSVFFANECKSTKVVAVEADQDNYSVLAQNCNGYDKIELMNFAAHDHEGMVGISRPAPNNTGMNHVVDGEDVCCQRLDAMLNGEKVAVLKIDVEGLALEVLRGAEDIVRHNLPVIAVEVGDDGSEIGGFLGSHGYAKIGTYNHTPTELWIA